MEFGSAVAGVASMSLCFTFLVAAVGKANAGRNLRRAVAAYRVVGSDPDSLRVGALAAVVVLAELGLAVGAVMWGSDRWVLALLGVTLLAAFSAASASVLGRDDKVECSCFGLTSGSRSEPITWRHLARNGLLAVLWIPAASAAPLAVWESYGVAAFAVITLAGLCLSALLMELPTVLSVAFSPDVRAAETQGGVS